MSECKPYCVYGNMDTRFIRLCMHCGKEEKHHDGMEGIIKEAFKQLNSPEPDIEIPEVMFRHVANGDIVPEDRQEYRLKFTEDTTIRELAEVMKFVCDNYSWVKDGDADLLFERLEEALKVNAPRIEEAQEGQE